MGLTDYFETTEGTGILATADSDGNVDAAIYAHPHMEDDETLVLVMADKLSHANLQTNPKATYMFIEKARVIRARGCIFRRSVKRMILNWCNQSEDERDMTKKARLYPEAVLYTSRSSRFDHWLEINAASKGVEMNGLI